ncbi:lipopolysaccharide biosynthesis protein [Planococcus salinus]|uniref:Flippase n=1 Tax=Planococcus salinus TaxID=1848460 RepID=A0A3M8P7E8_9BACL|nr:oligosaccharide flippase family protein [Planococcus salinus]RNF39619.1 flippase [Planococcus salinus]
MSKDQIKSGAILSYVNILLTTIVGILFTPFLLKELGQSEYGLYMLIGSLVGYISIMDFGLHNTIYRFISKYQSEEDYRKQENFLATSFLIYCIISLLVLAVGIVLVKNLDFFFANSLSAEEFAKAQIMAAILVFNLTLTLPLGSFQFIARGYGKFNFVNTLSILRIFLRTGVLLSILLMGYQSVAIVVVDTIFNIGIGLVYGVYCFKFLNLRVKLHNLNKAFIKEILNYSFFVFIQSIVNQLFWQIGQVTLGIYNNTAAVAIYALSINLVMYYQQFSLSISSVFMPKVSILVTKGATGDDLTNLMIKVGRVQFLILGLVLSSFVILGESFVQLWAGPSYTEVYWVTLIIFIPLTIPMFQTLAGVIIQVKNKHAFKAYAYLVMAVLNVPASILLGTLMGPLGVGVSTAVSIIVFQVIIINWYYWYKIGINVKKFFKETLKGILSVIILTIFLGHFFPNIGGLGWLDLFLKTIFVVTTYIILICTLGLNSSEKNVVKKYNKRILMKFKKS